MFKNKLLLTSLFLVFVLFLAACSPTQAEVQEQINNLEALIASLEASGAAVEVEGEVTQPFFSVDAQVIRVNDNEVQVFIYPDEDTAAAEADMVSPDGTAVGPNMMSWIDTPHFYRLGNVIVLYIGNDETTLDLLETLFGPQFAGG